MSKLWLRNGDVFGLTHLGTSLLMQVTDQRRTMDIVVAGTKQGLDLFELGFVGDYSKYTQDAIFIITLCHQLRSE